MQLDAPSPVACHDALGTPMHLRKHKNFSALRMKAQQALQSAGHKQTVFDSHFNGLHYGVRLG